MLQPANRLLILLVSLVFWGMICLTYPANAAPQTYNTLSLMVKTPPASKAPIFDPKKVYLGITPTGWVNDDDPTIDADPPITFEQIVSEIALADFQGSSKGHKYPNDTDELSSELELRGLRISEPWVGTYFTSHEMEKQIWQTFDQQVSFMKAMGGNAIVVAELGGAVHQQQEIAPLPNRPQFTNEQWDKLINGLNDMGEKAAKQGMKLCYHPHVGTGVEVMADIDRLMAGTNPDYVKLLLDTGHLYYAGVNPMDVVTKYKNRIGHVHLKNIRDLVLRESIENKVSFLNSIRAGVFTVPGDPDGAIDFKPILETLAAADYEGWLVVEAEQDPKTTNPLQNAQIARAYLQDVTGL
ncbi:MAG: myo-inosose-2 dehydratase [Cyanothece sp. SIO1E1]|nr:myo-inosose-2 dehydratase [Cyanothece sp. SIO1E1]